MAITGKQWDARGIEAAGSGKLAAWRAPITRQTQAGGELLRRILNGPIRFMADGRIYRFHGKAALDRLLSGAVPNLYGSPDGIVSRLGHNFPENLT